MTELVVSVVGCVESPSSLRFQLSNIRVRSRVACHVGKFEGELRTASSIVLQDFFKPLDLFGEIKPRFSKRRKSPTCPLVS